MMGEDFVEFGAEEGRRYRAALTVVAMGDANGVAWAQECHEYILKAGNLLGVDETLRFGQALPHSSCVEGAYVDDHVFAAKVELQRMQCQPGHDPNCVWCQEDGGELEDVQKVRTLEATYDRFGAARSTEKETRFAGEFTAWGTAVNGRSGEVAVCRDKRR